MSTHTHTTVTTTTAPRVWVGCLNCYNHGNLIGDWFDADEAADLTINDVHHHWVDSQDMYCEELHIFDTDCIPIHHEPSIAEAARWGELYSAVGENLWPAFCAWVRCGAYIEDGDGYPSVSAFEERYSGCWDSFRDYSDAFINETGLLDTAPLPIARYFDYEAYARDLEYEYTVVDAPESGVHIFLNL